MGSWDSTRQLPAIGHGLEQVLGGWRGTTRCLPREWSLRVRMVGRRQVTRTLPLKHRVRVLLVEEQTAFLQLSWKHLGFKSLSSADPGVSRAGVREALPSLAVRRLLCDMAGSVSKLTSPVLGLIFAMTFGYD
ncbi:hypothetical protein E2C01_013357 [Portunus trituberculatus]|uniref:Uncharacterized protein n=1 Tax=Portunus trituberculatus TaxID=210409 RepID=A0A5B7DGT5_PORTR|nr:hypothetical protein [Portunus trituberculatus]